MWDTNRTIVDRPVPEKYRTVRAMKLRGEWSLGFVVNAPKGAKEGDDVSFILVPPEQPVNLYPSYDYALERHLIALDFLDRIKSIRALSWY